MKKVLKILVIVLIIVLIVFIGRRIYYTIVGIKPEDLYLVKEDTQEQIKATRGSYSWNDKGLSVIADSISPLDMDFSKVIEVKPNDKIFFSDYEWTNVGASLILAKERKEIAKVTIETNLEENYIIVPEVVSGEYIIQIIFESDKGNVWYATKINITENVGE